MSSRASAKRVASSQSWKVERQDTLLAGHDLRRAFLLAEEIGELLQTLFPVMEDLCQATCAGCRRPCCRRAHVWYDFKDLVFMH